MPTPLPYGLRDMKVTGYTAPATLASASVDLPNARVLSFSETEEFQELRGDDKVVTTRGQGPAVEWDLESGGLPYEAIAIMFGGEVVETGTGSTMVTTYTKKATDERPFFKIEGQAISDSGGDVHCVMDRCRATGNFEGEFSDGEFFLTSGSGVALPSLISARLDTIYEFVHNATVTATP